MTLALGILIFGYLDTVKRRVALKVPERDVDEVANDAMVSALKSAFDGTSVGEFRAWLHRITSRRIADYHRAKEGKPELGPLLTGEEEDARPADVPSVEFEGVRVDVEQAIESAYATRGEPHQRIIDLYVFEDRPASEVAAELDTSEDNVHQVASRFRKDVRAKLDDGDTQ